MFVPNESTSIAPVTAVGSQIESTPLPESNSVPSRDAVFLFNRGNRRYLDQRSRQVHLQPAEMPMVTLLIIVIFAVFMAFVAFQGAFNLSRWIVTHMAGVTTRGYVVEKHISRGKSTTYTVTYSFVVNDQTYQTSQQVDSSVYNQANEVVEVTYWPVAPNFARLSGNFEVGSMFLSSGVQLFCPGIFVALMGAITVAGFRAWRKVVAKQRLLRDEGHLIYGEVICCKGVNRAKQGYKVTVRYGFRTPDAAARWVITQQERTLNWMRRKPLPAKGTPVAILYADGKNLEML